MFAKLYGSDYFLSHEYGKDPKREAMYLLERDRIYQRSHGGMVLDIGCGVGAFLETFDDSWHKYGVEISSYAAGKARERGITVRPIGDYACMTFDLVVMRGTLQHFDRPFEMLQTARRLLKPVGLLAILATPNNQSRYYRRFGTLPALDPPRNFWIPGARELENVLTNLGFWDIETLYPYRDTPYAEPAKDHMHYLWKCITGRGRFAFPGSMMEVYARV